MDAPVPDNSRNTDALDRQLALTAGCIFVAVTVLFFLTRSASLDEWDSVQFAQALGGFNLYEHHPHPPGYPVYIFLAWLAHLIPGVAPQAALLLVSAISGGILCATWFVYTTLMGDRRLAVLLSLGLAVLPVIWMTATKALTDIPAAAGLAVVVLLGTVFRRSRDIRWLLVMAVAGALSVGIRPQNFHIVLIIMATFLWKAPVLRRWYILGPVVFLVANLLWLIPVLWTQASLEPGGGDWLAYPRQLLEQWRWRLDKPDAYIGAGGGLGKRLSGHWGGWFHYGFGFRSNAPGYIGAALYFGGVALYVARGLWRRPSDRELLRMNAPWFIVYILTVFSFLPDAPRYYSPIYPLLLYPAMAGWWSLRGLARWMAVVMLVPVFVFVLPLVHTAHTEEAPPIRMIRFIEDRHPPDERGRVMLILLQAWRHGEWYGSDFEVIRSSDVNPSTEARAREAIAVYTDWKSLLRENPWPGSESVPLASFQRSRWIYDKHRDVDLYEIRFDGNRDR